MGGRCARYPLSGGRRTAGGATTTAETSPPRRARARPEGGRAGRAALAPLVRQRAADPCVPQLFVCPSAPSRRGRVPGGRFPLRAGGAPLRGRLARSRVVVAPGVLASRCGSLLCRADARPHSASRRGTSRFVRRLGERGARSRASAPLVRRFVAAQRAGAQRTFSRDAPSRRGRIRRCRRRGCVPCAGGVVRAGVARVMPWRARCCPLVLLTRRCAAVRRWRAACLRVAGASCVAATAGASPSAEGPGPVRRR